MKHHRPERVGALIQKELGRIILREMETRDALVTITSVDVDKKLEHAMVYVSVLLSGETVPAKAEERADRAVERLNARRPYLQTLLHHTLNIRPMPTIVFKRDRGLERAANVEKALLGH